MTQFKNAIVHTKYYEYGEVFMKAKLFFTVLILFTIFSFDLQRLDALDLPIEYDDGYTYYEEDDPEIDSGNLFVNDVSSEDYIVDDYVDADRVDELEAKSEKSQRCLFRCYKSKYNKDSHENNNSKNSPKYLGNYTTNGTSSYTRKYTYANIHDTGKNYSSKSSDRDVDYYYFKLDSSHRFEVYMYNIPSGQDYDIVLYKYKDRFILNDVYTQLASSTRGGNSSEIIDSYNNNGTKQIYLEAGTYAIKVYSYKGVSNSKYTLRITTKPVLDSYESNDYMDQATPLGNFSGYNQYNYDKYKNYYNDSINVSGTIHSKKDVDYYKFRTYGDNTDLLIRLDSSKAKANYKLAVYDESLSEIDISNDILYSSNRAYVRIRDLNSQVFYIKVYSDGNYNVDKKYELTIEYYQYADDTPVDTYYDSNLDTDIAYNYVWENQFMNYQDFVTSGAINNQFYRLEKEYYVTNQELVDEMIIFMEVVKEFHEEPDYLKILVDSLQKETREVIRKDLIKRLVREVMVVTSKRLLTQQFSDLDSLTVIVAIPGEDLPEVITTTRDGYNTNQRSFSSTAIMTYKIGKFVYDVVKEPLKAYMNERTWNSMYNNVTGALNYARANNKGIMISQYYYFTDDSKLYYEVKPFDASNHVITTRVNGNSYKHIYSNGIKQDYIFGEVKRYNNSDMLDILTRVDVDAFLSNVLIVI